MNTMKRWLDAVNGRQAVAAGFLSTHRDHLALVLGLSAFLALFLAIPAGYLRTVFVLLVIPLGLVLSISLPWAAAAANTVGLLVLLTGTASAGVLVPAIIGAMLLVTAVFPLYFHEMSGTLRREFWKRYSGLLEKADALQESLASHERRRRDLEQEIAKINQLYILGRELVEHMDLSEVLEHLHRVLTNRPGVTGVSVFAWERNDWRALYLSGDGPRSQWLEFMRGQRPLRWEKKYRQLTPPEWLRDRALVFWPVRLPKEPLLVILLVVRPDAAPRYLEEGEIFIPQIALGLKRTRLFAEVQERSRNDGLTGLYLRRYFLERLATEIQRAKRYGTVFSVLLADIDFFKNVNDTYGHLVGDRVLCTIARLFVDCARPGDLVGRYGGEEFIVFLPMTPPEEAERFAAEIGRVVAAKDFAADSGTFKTTISIGISSYAKHGDSTEELLTAADQALYWVKTHGRNGVKHCRDIA